MNTYIQSDNHVQAYHAQMIVLESKRVKRTLKGLELTEAKSRSKRLTFAEMGLSSTNLVFNSDLASDCLDPEILEILKDDPDKDHGIMYTRVPTDAQTSTIGESDRGGAKSLDTDTDDDDQYQFIQGFELAALESIASGSERIIDRLPLFIHDLKRWSTGFKVAGYYKAEKLRAKKALAACMGDELVTTRGTLRQRKPKAVSSTTKRTPRKRNAKKGLQA